MEEIPNNHLGCKNPVNNGKLPTSTGYPDFFHQQYVQLVMWLGLISIHALQHPIYFFSKVSTDLCMLYIYCRISNTLDHIYMSYMHLPPPKNHHSNSDPRFSTTVAAVCWVTPTRWDSIFGQILPPGKDTSGYP